MYQYFVDGKYSHPMNAAAIAAMHARGEIPSNALIRKIGKDTPLIPLEVVPGKLNETAFTEREEKKIERSQPEQTPAAIKEQQQPNNDRGRMAAVLQPTKLIVFALKKIPLNWAVSLTAALGILVLALIGTQVFTDKILNEQEAELPPSPKSRLLDFVRSEDKRARKRLARTPTPQCRETWSPNLVDTQRIDDRYFQNPDPIAWNAYRTGMDYYRSKQYSKALEILEAYGENNTGPVKQRVKSLNIAARLYETVFWKENGFPDRQRGVNRSRNLFLKSANMGNPEAQVAIARYSLIQPCGLVGADWETIAREWLKLAITSNSSEAFVLLAELSNSTAESIKHYLSAAHLGSVRAQLQLAHLYNNPETTAANREQKIMALSWYQIAARSEDLKLKNLAEENVRRMKSELSSSEVAAADYLVEECLTYKICEL